MKKSALIILLSLSSFAFAQDVTADFTGFYTGFQAGINRSKATGGNPVSKTTTFPGFVIGYATNLNGLLVGTEAFADYHNNSTTFKDGGLGLKVGKVFSNILVFGRFGTTGSWPSWRAQAGIGAEAKLDQNTSFIAFFSNDKSTDAGIERENNSFSIGVNYYFK